MNLGSPYRNKIFIKGPVKTEVYKFTASSANVLTEQTYLLIHETKNCLNLYYLKLPLNLKENTACGYDVRTGMDHCPRSDMPPPPKKKNLHGRGLRRPLNTAITWERFHTQNWNHFFCGECCTFKLQCIAERHRYLTASWQLTMVNGHTLESGGSIPAGDTEKYCHRHVQSTVFRDPQGSRHQYVSVQYKWRNDLLITKVF